MIHKTGCSLWWKPDKTMVWLIIQVRSTLKMKLSYHDRSDEEFFCEKNQIGQRCDWLYKSSLCKKRYWIFMINQFRYRLWWKPNRTMKWLIVQMRSTPKMKLSCHDRLDRVWSMTKTRQDNDMTDHIVLFYTKYKTELLGPIYPGVVFDEIQIEQRRDR